MLNLSNQICENVFATVPLSNVEQIFLLILLGIENLILDFKTNLLCILTFKMIYKISVLDNNWFRVRFCILAFSGICIYPLCHLLTLSSMMDSNSYLHQEFRFPWHACEPSSSRKRTLIRIIIYYFVFGMTYKNVKNKVRQKKKNWKLDFYIKLWKVH